MLREVVSQVGSAGAPIDTEHLLRFLASYPKEAHVPRLASFALHVVVADAVRCGVVYLDGCLSLRMAHLDQSVTCGDSFSCVKKIDPISASAALDMTVLIKLAVFSTAPLFAGIGTSLAKKKCPPARLRALGSLRYDASLTTARCMSLLRYVKTASGCVEA